MQTAPKGDENKDQKVPTDPGDNKPLPAPEAKGPTTKEVVDALDASDLALQKAEAEIVRLKKQANKSGDPNANEDEISALKAEIEELKKRVITRDDADPLVQEIASVRKRNAEYRAALISKETRGSGTGQGSNQDAPAPTDTKPTETDGERALRERMERRRIAEGRDPKTGLKINK